MADNRKEAAAKKLEVILNRQEFVLAYIDMLHGLSEAGGTLSATARKFHNELQLALKGVKVAERN